MHNLIIILGPTGIGKTDTSISLAKQLQTEIISADSRQIYREMSIGTATPNAQQLHTVKHHFIQTNSIHEYLNVSHFEQMVLDKLSILFEKHKNIVMTGGSMMYIDVVCNGIDDLPTIDTQIREQLLDRFNKEGIEPLRLELKNIDPEYYTEADLRNHKRIIHALEIFYMTGKPYSSFLTKEKKTRDFNIIKIGLNTDRQILHQRINTRVDQMIDEGLIDEAKELYQFKHLNALNTVGYRELFAWMDGQMTMDEAIEKIKTNSRRYARRQLTWFNKDKSIKWFDIQNKSSIFEYIDQLIANK